MCSIVVCPELEGVLPASQVLYSAHLSNNNI